MTKAVRPDFAHDAAPAPANPAGDPLAPVLWSPSITVNRVPRHVIEHPPGTFALYAGEPGALSVLSYPVTWAKGLARARDILAGRWPQDTQRSLLTLAALIVAADQPVDGPANYVAIAADVCRIDDDDGDLS